MQLSGLLNKSRPTLDSRFLENLADNLSPRRTLSLQQLESNWELWLRTLFPKYLQKTVTIPNAKDPSIFQTVDRDISFGEHHREFWEHVVSISPGHRPP